MKSNKILIAGLFALASLFSTGIKAQSDADQETPNKPDAGNTKFLLAGKAGAVWTATTPVTSASAPNSFNPISLMLMPLVKVNDRLFLDAQIEVFANPFNGGGTTLNLNELIMYYRINPYMNLFFGNFSPKYGLYMGVLDDFTNRFCSSPVGLGHGPQTQTGVGLQGGIQTGTSKMNYQIYVANGPQLFADTGKGNNNAGLLNYANYTDNNAGKAIGGSLGWLPFSTSSLQLDVSGQYAPTVGDKGTPWENVSSTSFAADLNYYKVFNPIMIRVLSEYNSTHVSNYNYQSVDATKFNPSFTNFLSGWYAGATVRASGSSSDLFRNLELGVRYSQFTSPIDAPWGATTLNQTTVCLTYWFTWKTPLNLAWDSFQQNGAANTNQFTVRSIFFF